MTVLERYWRLDRPASGTGSEEVTGEDQTTKIQIKLRSASSKYD